MARLLLTALLLLPFAASAQGDVRSQIRAELMQDPRTAEMSTEELDLLVEALAGEAASSEEGAVYMDAQTAPVFVYDAPPVATPSPFLAMLSTPIVLAILALLAGVLGLVWFMLRHRNHPDLQNS